MKRITYISRTDRILSKEEVNIIGELSRKNNEKVNITGLLVYFEKLFFQIIEGEDEDIDEVYVKIGKDPRHIDILRLKTEYKIDKRLFPQWSMNIINLDDNVDDLLRPIKILLQTVAESHSIVEKYTQPTILKILNQGINPLTVDPVPVERVILFADIISYSTISEKLPVEKILLIINTYFEICSRIIFSRGGEVNKFMGDGLMAYFNIGQADNAIHSCLEIMKELSALHKCSDDDSPLKILNSGFGLAQGLVIEGNMGSRFKTDYTIIGDPVNTAARLEGLTREVKRSLVLSESVKNNTKEKWNFKSLGKYFLKGKKNKREIFTIKHKLVSDFKDDIFG